jgi:hypothetical protein
MPNDEIRIASCLPELIAFYQEGWVCGYPLLLNPNWRVVLDRSTMLPVCFGDELSTPVVDDCGLAMLKHQLSAAGKKFEDIKADAYHYLEELAQSKRNGAARVRVAGVYSTSIIPRAALVLARKKLAESFYELRRWQLMPPLIDRESQMCWGRSPESIAQHMQQSPTRRGRVVSTAFEAYRASRVRDLYLRFEDECAMFQIAFGNEDGKFVGRLKMYADGQE